MAEAKSIKSLTKDFAKAYGPKLGGIGWEPAQIARCPTGIFQYDLGCGGGYPKNKVSIDYGPESSGKSLKLYKAIIFMQNWKPELTNILFDVEGTYDPHWFRRLGGDPTKLSVYRPDYAEQVVDMIELMLRAPDCGIIGIDSVAAFLTTKELNQSAEKEPVGALALAMSKLIGKAVGAMIAAEKEDYWGTLVLINQTRTKIGVMYGDPESYPGGNKQRFASSLSNRMYGKNLVDKGQTQPHAKHHSCIIKKWKCPIMSTHIEWDTYTRAYNGKPVGYTGGWSEAEKVLRSADLLTKVKEGWQYGDAVLPTLHAWEEHFDFNPMLRVNMVSTILAKIDLEMTAGEEIDPEFDKIDPTTGEVLELG